MAVAGCLRVCFCRWHGRFILGKIRKALLCLIRSFRSEIFEQSVCCLGLSGTKLLQTDSPFGFNLQCYSEAICFRNDCTNATWISGFFGHGKPWSPATAPAGGSDMLASRHSLSASVAKPDDFCFADPWMKFLRLIPKRTPLPTPRNQCRIHAACVKAYTVRMHVYVCISMLSSHVPSFVQHTKHMLCHVLSVNKYFTNTIYNNIYIYVYTNIYQCTYICWIMHTTGSFRQRHDPVAAISYLHQLRLGIAETLQFSLTLNRDYVATFANSAVGCHVLIFPVSSWLLHNWLVTCWKAWSSHGQQRIEQRKKLTNRVHLTPLVKHMWNIANQNFCRSMATTLGI